MKISVITYVSSNNFKKIQLIRGVRSFIFQTYLDRELIIVVDSLQSDPAKILDAYFSGFPEIRVVENTNSVRHPFNVGLDHAHGKIVSYMNHSDILLPSHLKNIVKYWKKGLEDNDKLTFAFNRCRIMHPSVFKLNSGFMEPYIRPPSIEDIKIKDLERFGIVDPPFVVLETPLDTVCLDIATITHRRDLPSEIRWTDNQALTESILKTYDEPKMLGRFYSETYAVGFYEKLWDL